MAFHLLEKREGFVASLEASDMNRSPNRPTALIQQNEILSSKIELIEKQNLEQQKRLQQLERLVMELSCNRSQVEVLEHRQPNSGQDANCNGNVMKTNKSFNAGLYSKNNNCVSQQVEHFSKVRTGEPLSNSPHLDEGFPQHKTVNPVICKRIFEKSNISATGTSTTSLEESDSVKPDGKLSNPQQELQMSDDVMSIMEEFDRTARENGLTYSMTPIGSVVGSEDVMENVEATREWSAALKGFSPVREETQVFGINDVTLPSSVFLTPVFQRPAQTLCQYNGQDGPMITPQACLTTPVLLTSEALRAVEKAHDRHRDRIEERPMPFHRRLSSCGNDAKKPQPSYLDLKLRKANPFSNLLNGLRQASNSVGCNNSNRDIYCGRVGWSEKAQLHADKTKNVESPFCSPTNSCNSNSSGHIRNWRQSLKLGNLSPSTESNCSDLNTQLPFCSPHSCTSGHIRRWRESLKLTYLSPMPESYCSDLETHASEDDLVVDELVSISVGKGNTATTTTTNTVINTRQRNDSLNSITGLCVPPDLLLDTGMRQVTENEEDFDEIEEENVLTEIAGVFDGDLPLEDSMILTDDGSVSVPLVKFKNEELLSIESKDDVIVKEEEEVEEDIEVEEELAPVESVSQVDKNLEPQEESEDMVKSDLLQTGGVFRNVAELIGNTGKSESLVCKKVKSTQGLQEKTLRVDGKDVKLRAGSIILAVVNEAGGLVPLPQLQVKNPKLSKAFKEDSSIEEEVDVETVCEKSPVLEAGDVDSLLAQFEASEAVNIPSMEKSSSKHKSNSPSTKAVIASNSVKSGRQKSVSSIVPADTSQASPTHQKIKDALPKEIIEKIKASTKRKSTQMLSEPLAMRKGRGGRLQESNQHRSKTHRAPSSTSVQQSSSDQRVPPPLDHDYCFSPDKQKKNKNSSDNTSRSEEYFNKLPDYYTVKVSKGDGKKPINSSDDNHDDNGKKDSGVESGDVSDASVEPEDRRKERTIESGQSRDEWEKGKSENITDGKCSEDIYNKLPSYMTDIGNSKPKDNDAEEREGGGRGEGEKEECEDKEEKREIKKIKRKLNLSEYRQRIQSAQSSRCPSPAQTDVMPKTINNIPLSIGELIQKMKEAEAEKAKESVNSKVPEQKCENSVLPVEDVEEGELKGDSDIEVSTHEISKPIASVDSKIEKHVEGRKENKVPFSSPSSLSSTSTSNSRESRKNSSRVYPSRRWSSSSQSSRSRSRTPSAKKKKKHHSSRSSRSSRGKRRGARRSSRSSVSPCRCCSRSRSRSHSRSRSRSLSRSRGRSSSESSYCSTCSCSSRSRSRSHSSKKRGRRGYSRRYERRRRTRSRSRSSSRYSRSSRRSRSPTWRDINRSRSPSRRPMMPRREDGDRLKQVEERRVIYVGRISDGTTKADLRHRFSKYGVIVDISVHFRDRGDNYGFVTYKNKSEAYSAVENGNSDPAYPRYDLCFGGRRAFCRVQYSDLDAQDDGFGGSGPGSKGRGSGNSDFDSLLRAAMKRKTR